MGAPGSKPRQRAAQPVISARLASHVTLDVHSYGAIFARSNGDSVSLGTFGSGAAERAQELRTGRPLSSLALGSSTTDKEIDLLVRRLASRGLVEFLLGDGQVVIEPQIPGYWPQIPQLGDADVLALSRFAYIRRRGNELVLESPLAGALFKFRDPKLASFVAMLSAPQPVTELRRQEGFPGLEFLALLVDSQILFRPDHSANPGLRLAEGDHDLVLWDFHDLLFHTRSSEGRHGNPVGATYPHGGAIPPLPALRPSWPGKKADLRKLLESQPQAMPPVAKLFRERHSTRSFDNGRPITLAELSRFLDGAARALPPQPGSAETGAPQTVRPYPTAGASCELELYLAVNICEGFAPGFYHYDASDHALAEIQVPAPEVKALLAGAATAMGVTAAPQILITIAARFGRVSWKYSSIAYALILKDAGVLTQTFYLMAAGMGLGGCAIGLANIGQFAKMTGIGFHVEGPVGQFALGRPGHGPPGLSEGLRGE